MHVGNDIRDKLGTKQIENIKNIKKFRKNICIQTDIINKKKKLKRKILKFKLTQIISRIKTTTCTLT